MSRIILAICRRSMGATLGCLALASAAHAQWLNPPTGASVKQATGTPGLLFCNGYELLPGCAAGIGSGDPLVLLEQLSPASGNGVSTQFRGGWPLIFRASVKGEEMLGIGRMDGNQWFERLNYQFPEIGQGGAIVFADADNLWSYSVPPPGSPRDERVLPFYPDSGDITRYADDVAAGPLSHDPALRFALRPEFGGPLPQFGFDLGELSTTPQIVFADGVQFGADDDFPGLVILSNVGVGIVMTPLAQGWNPVVPRQARNLAGFVTSVGYELDDASDRTSITAVMMVPRFLFSHLQLIDVCVGAVTFDGNGDPVSCAEGAVQRLDGGPITPAAVNDLSEVELRAFVVDPVWSAALGRLETLDVVTDMNADGRLTSTDAELMGWRVLSNEVVYEFRQIGTFLTFRRQQYSPLHFCQSPTRPDAPPPALRAGASFDFDIDGNGYSVFDFSVVCPPGGSGVTRPPR